MFFLTQNPNKVFSRQELLQNIWGMDVYVIDRTVDVHIRKIREKVGEDLIKTIKGVGYKFELELHTKFRKIGYLSKEEIGKNQEN